MYGKHLLFIFKRAILIATQIEISRTIAKNIKLDKETVDSVFMLKSHSSSGGEKKLVQQKAGKGSFLCGSFQLLANYKGCAAGIDPIHIMLKRIGPFAKVCHSNQFNHQAHVVTVSDVTIWSVAWRILAFIPLAEKIMCSTNATAEITLKELEVMLDTGSAVSILSESGRDV